jgi:hypothetical protein
MQANWRGMTLTNAAAAADGTRRRVAIVQSNYIPWKGYFDLIGSVDEFLLLDEVQYTPRNWRNRNQIKTQAGLRWLTLPVRTSGRRFQRIDEVLVADREWPRSHWSAIEQAYRKAPHFDEIAHSLAPLYRQLRELERLSDINRALLEAVCELLGIDTPILWSTDYESVPGLSERLLALCQAVGADEYVSGPLARAYLDVELFARAGVRVAWIDYSGYPPYRQLHGQFTHNVSVLDLLFCEGSAARSFLKAPLQVPSVQLA